MDGQMIWIVIGIAFVLFAGFHVWQRNREVPRRQPLLPELKRTVEKNDTVSSSADVPPQVQDLLMRFLENGDTTEAERALWRIARGDEDIEVYTTLHLIVDHAEIPLDRYVHLVETLSRTDVQYALFRYGRAYYWRRWFDQGSVKVECPEDLAEDLLVRMFPLVGWIDTPDEQQAFLTTLTPLGAIRAVEYLNLGPVAYTRAISAAVHAVTSDDATTMLKGLEAILAAGGTVEDMRDAFQLCMTRLCDAGKFMPAYRVAAYYLEDNDGVVAVEQSWTEACKKSSR